jgi:hypothetical protein
VAQRFPDASSVFPVSGSAGAESGYSVPHAVLPRWGVLPAPTRPKRIVPVTVTTCAALTCLKTEPKAVAPVHIPGGRDASTDFADLHPAYVLSFLCPDHGCSLRKALTGAISALVGPEPSRHAGRITVDKVGGKPSMTFVIPAEAEDAKAEHQRQKRRKW